MATEEKQMTDENQVLEESDIVAQRKAKLATLRQQGNAFPNDFRRKHTAVELHDQHGENTKEGLAEEKFETVIAGRVMLRRAMGKASFVTASSRRLLSFIFAARISSLEGLNLSRLSACSSSAFFRCLAKRTFSRASGGTFIGSISESYPDSEPFGSSFTGSSAFKGKS